MLQTKIKDEDIKKRIRDVIRLRGGNASALARSMSLNSAYFVSMLNSQEKGISATVYKALLKNNVNINWLITGEGSMSLEDKFGDTFQSWKDRALTAEKTIEEYERDIDNLHFLIKNLERMILDTENTKLGEFKNN